MYLELSRRPPIDVVGSISVCQEQLSEVPRVVEGTSNSRKYLRLAGAVIRGTSSCQGTSIIQKPGARAVIQSTSSCREHLQLSKVPSVVESEFCQTGSVIIFTFRLTAYSTSDWHSHL